MTVFHRAMHLLDNSEIVIVASDDADPGVPVPDATLGRSGLARYRVDESESAAECLADNGWTMVTLWEPVSRTAETCDVVPAREVREARA